MVFATLAGLGLQAWAGVHDAGEIGFFLGLVVAALWPTKNQSCSLPER